MPVVGITHSARKVLPGTPIIGTATDVGTNRPYNNGAVSITFTPADSYATSFTASGYCSVHATTHTATGASSPLTITGFGTGVITNITVTASNAIGTSAASAASNSVTVTTVPQAPSTIGTLSINGSQSLSLNTWGSVTNSSPSNGGKTISHYTARLFPGSLNASPPTVASPGTVTWSSLTAGNSYTANAYAVNANGESAASPSSNSATAGQAPTLSTNPSFTASGNVVTLTSGVWNYSPTSYTYRIATSLANLNAGTYVLNSTTTNTYTGSYSTTYYGRVIATNAYGSGTSADFTTTTGAAPAPLPVNYAAPTLTAATASGDASVTPYDKLTCTSGSWTNSPTSYEYRIYSYATGQVVGGSALTTATSFVFQDTQGYNIEYGTQYYAIVYAKNANSTGDGTASPASNVAQTAAYYVPPVTPSGTLSVSNITSSQCTATFTVSNAASWDIRGSYVGGAFYLGSLNAASPVTVTNLPAGASGVSIILNMWTGANRTGTLYQVSQTINVPAASTAPSTPTVSNAFSTGPTWTASWSSTGTTPITYYWNFYQSQTSGGTITATASGNTEATGVVINGNSSYGLWGYFTVYASNLVGSSGTATSNWA